MRTCKIVEIFASQFSVDLPYQVPSRLRQTLPQAYKLGLKRMVPLPVVVRFIFGGPFG